MFSHQSMIVLLTALYTELSWGLPTSLFILLCHSVTAWSISSSYVSSKRGLKYLSYDLKYPHTRFFIWPYEHQSYSYSPRPRMSQRQTAPPSLAFVPLSLFPLCIKRITWASALSVALSLLSKLNGRCKIKWLVGNGQ